VHYNTALPGNRADFSCDGQIHISPLQCLEKLFRRNGGDVVSLQRWFENAVRHEGYQLPSVFPSSERRRRFFALF
jgi:hypothetical protein